MLSREKKINKKSHKLAVVTFICVSVFLFSLNFDESNKATSNYYVGNDSAPIIDIPEPSMIDDILKMLGVSSSKTA